MAYFGTWKRTYFSNLYVRWMRDYVLSNHYNFKDLLKKTDPRTLVLRWWEFQFESVVDQKREMVCSNNKGISCVSEIISFSFDAEIKGGGENQTKLWKWKHDAMILRWTVIICLCSCFKHGHNMAMVIKIIMFWRWKWSL